MINIKKQTCCCCNNTAEYTLTINYRNEPFCRECLTELFLKIKDTLDIQDNEKEAL